MIVVYLIAIISVYIGYCFMSINFWRKQGVSGPLPLPVIRDAFYYFRKSPVDVDYENLRKYGRIYVNFISLTGLTLNVSDPQLIKEILVKNFPEFHRKFAFPSLVPYFGKSLIFIDGPAWKRIRLITTPIFTSGRLRQIWSQIPKPVTNSLNVYEQKIESNGGKAKLNVKKLSYYVTIDIIGKVVFSMDVDCYRNQNDPFLRNVFKLNTFSLFNVITLALIPAFLIKLLKINSFDMSAIYYYANLTEKLIELRKKQPDLKYQDFLQLLIDSEADSNDLLDETWEKQSKKLNVEEIVGQTLFFFLAGVDTVSASIAFTLFMLAKNVEIQDQLYNELLTTYPNDEINIDDLNKCQLLNNVINETQRLLPSVTRLSRRAAQDHTLSNGIKVKKNTPISIQVYALHHDEEIYPDPFEFKPDRFLDMDNETKQYAFLPFSTGPMNCVGNRFAILEIKYYLARFLKKYKVEICADGSTQIKDKKLPFLYVVEDLYLDVSQR